MIELQKLRELQLDALREVASIGAGHAATALSQMTSTTIMISVPRITVARMADVPSRVGPADEPIAVVHMHMLGDLSGRTMLVLPRATAVRLSALMIRRPGRDAEQRRALEASAIKESGNILCGAYMNALGEFLGLMLLPSPPTMTMESSAQALTSGGTDFGGAYDFVVAVETEFYLDREEILRGFFLLMPDVQSLDQILRAARVA